MSNPYDDVRSERAALRSNAKREVEKTGQISTRTTMALERLGVDTNTLEQDLLEQMRK